MVNIGLAGITGCGGMKPKGFPKRISARFDIVTPMFLGDAEHAASRIREASIKGALAFWWRALNFAAYVERAGSQAEGLKTMQADEQHLFGGAKAGQGAFLLKVKSGPGPGDHLRVGHVLAKDWTGFTNPARNDKRVVGEGVRYLGYGILNAFYTKAKNGKPAQQAGELIRSCFTKGADFEVELVFSPRLDGKDVAALKRAVQAFGLLGGLGARKRRGFGSVALKSLVEDGTETWEPPISRVSYVEKLKEVLGENLPNQDGRSFVLSAIAGETDIRIGTFEDTNGLEVLNDMGKGLLRYRAWGRPKGTYGSVDVEAQFEGDHDWFKKTGAFSAGRGAYVPERTAFGLPHNYSKVFGVTANGDLDRRASPLMLHVHKAGSKCFAVAMFLPVRFLPEAQASVWEQNDKNKTPYNYTFDPAVITRFLDNQRPDGGDPIYGDYFPNERVFE